MSTSFIRFLDELEHYKSFYFWKMKKIKDCPLKNQADGQPSNKWTTPNPISTFLHDSTITMWPNIWSRRQKGRKPYYISLIKFPKIKYQKKLYKGKMHVKNQMMGMFSATKSQRCFDGCDKTDIRKIHLQHLAFYSIVDISLMLKSYECLWICTFASILTCFYAFFPL